MTVDELITQLEQRVEGLMDLVVQTQQDKERELEAAEQAVIARLTTLSDRIQPLLTNPLSIATGIKDSQGQPVVFLPPLPAQPAEGD